MLPFFEGEAAQAGGLSSLISLVPLLAIVVIFYFLMYKPQKKQEKETNEMRNNLMIGDEICTIGGILGRVVKVKDDYIVIETGSDRTKIKFRKTAIASVEKKADDDGSKKQTFKVSASKEKTSEEASVADTAPAEEKAE